MNDSITKELVSENTKLNEQEYKERKIFLKSYPQAIFVQMDAPCNHNCIFCSRPDTYKWFDLDEFRKEFEELLFPVFVRVNRINLTGSGELLFLPEAKKNLEYFNQFKYAEKMFATNGSSLTPKMIDFILKSNNKYVIHVSLHSSNSDLHRIMTKNDITFPSILYNLDYIKKVKNSKLTLNLIFVATTKNIKDLPDFIEFAYEKGADSVIAYYNYVYGMDQKYLSCYFEKELTNEMLHKAREKLNQLNKDGRKMNLFLPPEFNKEYEINYLCKEAWSNIMINSEGAIISCDVSGDSYENVKGKKDFFEVWNGKYYTNLRKSLIERKNDCAKYCFRANPSAVNDFMSHIITRGKSKEEIIEFLRDT